MCLELILNVVNINFVTFSDFLLKRDIFSYLKEIDLFASLMAHPSSSRAPFLLGSWRQNERQTLDL